MCPQVHPHSEQAQGGGCQEAEGLCPSLEAPNMGPQPRAELPAGWGGQASRHGGTCIPSLHTQPGHCQVSKVSLTPWRRGHRDATLLPLPLRLGEGRGRGEAGPALP